ncbi:MAG: UDP-N-acetylmuramate dehydrogenase [Lachnospiraceae bacterium]|nr:UDP-N-acetylmuramate dehydrogenase [Ruminococcus sp.]MCM1274309.1 UDP-N-acetylmuramate dehydrogenase [Lachnospiraceae bacterium]
MDHSVIIAVCNRYGCFFEENFPLAGKTSMKIGGECGLFAEPSSEECLIGILKACRESGVPHFILGKGSNLLIKRFGGVVIATGAALGKISVDGNVVTAGAGAALSAVCNAALESSLSGMECLYGIPGSVGGALYMNAGAYGGEMRDVVRSARCVDGNGNVVELSADEMALSYRHSVFSENGFCVLSVTMELAPRDKAEIKAKMDELMQKRRDKQPLEFPSCGSTFKRPKDGFAAALIEECGLKGCTVGGAQVSEKHSGFVINRGGATFEDVMELVEHIKSTVRGKKGVELECEMLIVDK